MPTLKALKPLRYATRQLVAGDVFEAQPRDARVLQAIGRAEPHVEPLRRGPGRPSKAEVEAKRIADLQAIAEAEKAATPPPPVGWGEAAP